LIGVFDGHGSQGQFISNLLKIFFSEYFTKMDLYRSDTRTGFHKINTSIKKGFSEELNNIKNYSNNFDVRNFNNLNAGNSNSNLNSRKMNSFSYSNLNLNSTRKNSGNLNINYNYKENEMINSNNNINYFYEKLSELDFKIIRNSFSLAENSFIKANYDLSLSGSTSICLFVIENKVICANCGDSRAILITDDKFNVNKNLILNLSIDHKPDLKKEASRIIKNNGRIDKAIENGLRSGPLRVWLKNENYPGLCMTRSIGDIIASKIGVISEPEIIECNINDNSKFIVIASDGIWGVFTNEEVSNFVDPFYVLMDCESAVSNLIQEAKKRWREVKKI
jgi:serine/threonine protein phosphatase PrpC